MSKHFIPGDDIDEIKSWDLPYVEQPKTAEESQRTNAINRRSEWRYEPPEVEEEPQPPTAEEIEAIRQAAYDEGFSQGREEGHAKGLAEGREQGHQEGYTTGYDEGRAAGEEAGKEAVDAALANWQSLMDGLHQPLEQVSQQARQELVKLAVSLARAVIRTEVTLSNDVLMQALAEGFKALPIAETHYQIQMHPEDIQSVVEHMGEDSIQQKGWNLVEAPAMHRGGCDVSTTSNAVDVSIERRSKDVLTKFLTDQGLTNDG